MIHSEDIYWLLLAFESKLSIRKVNEIISQCYEKKNMSIEKLYQLSGEEIRNEFNFTNEDINKIIQSNSLSTGQAFLLESLEEQNITILKSIDERYPIKLKDSLPEIHPPILFCLGDLSMLDKKIIAIIGQRDAHPGSLDFVRKSAEYLSSHQIVVVSGFAKGVDQEAYSGAVNGGGQTIVVLAEGILSAKTAFRKISSSIEEGQVLVVSQFHPNSHWMTGQAMARNVVVTGLSDVTLVGQTKEDGGTMHGASSAIKLHKPIFVYMHPETDLKGAHHLIKKRAIPIDDFQKPIEELLKPVIKACEKGLMIYPEETDIEPIKDENQLELLPLEETKIQPGKSKKKKRK